MTPRTITCWPSCDDACLARVRDWLSGAAAAAPEEARVPLAGNALDALLVQVYADQIAGGLSFPDLRAAASPPGGRREAICFSFESGEAPPRFARHKHRVHLGKGEEEAERIALAFSKPLLAYDGFRPGHSHALLARLREIRRAAAAGGGGHPLFYGDVAMACYGLRLPRAGSAECVLLEAPAGPPAALEKAGVTAYSVEQWKLRHDVLLSYHGFDIKAVVDSRHAYFMGLMVPAAEVALDAALASVGGADSAVHLLDALMLKSMTGRRDRLPCVFADLAADSALQYSPRLAEAKDAYLEARSSVRELLCSSGDAAADPPDLGFHVRQTDDPERELHLTRLVQQAVDGMPVVPMAYGVVRCAGGAARLAVEAMDSTLAAWALKERSRREWLEVLGRAAWCVAVLERAGGMSHSRLTPSDVLLRGTEGRGKRRAAPVRLAGEPMPSHDWDVRLGGLDRVSKTEAAARPFAGLARDLLSLEDGPPPDVADLLREASRQELPETVEALSDAIRGARAATKT